MVLVQRANSTSMLCSPLESFQISGKNLSSTISIFFFNLFPVLLILSPTWNYYRCTCLISCDFHTISRQQLWFQFVFDANIAEQLIINRSCRKIFSLHAMNSSWAIFRPFLINSIENHCFIRSNSCCRHYGNVSASLFILVICSRFSVIFVSHPDWMHILLWKKNQLLSFASSLLEV